jgi:hypothetical protein
MYDIIDVLNCINVKYYKNYYENFSIVTFDDIYKTFTQLQVLDITPVECQNQVIFGKGWDGVKMCLANVQTKKSMIFVYNLHTIEKKGENDTIENIRFDNWYILMKNGYIIQENTLKKSTTTINIKPPHPAEDDTSNDALNDATNDAVANTSNDAVDNTSNDVVDNATNDVVDNATNDAPTNTSNDAVDDATNDDVDNNVQLTSAQEKIAEVLSRPKVTLKELKECLASFGLKVSGNKESLISRLRAHLNSGFL